jgi:glycosyltransferase involved in cell wall biosynthesis
MKILFVLDDYPPYIKGGTGVSTSLLANWLNNHGNTMAVACTNFTNESWIENGVTVYPIIYKPVFEAKNFLLSIWYGLVIIFLQIISTIKVLRLIREFKPEIVNVTPTSYRFIPIITGIRIFTNVPIVVDCVDYSFVCPAHLSPSYMGTQKEFDEVVQTHHGYRCIGYTSSNNVSFLSIRPFAIYESALFNLYKGLIRFLINNFDGIKLVAVSKFVQKQLILNGFKEEKTINIPDISESVQKKYLNSVSKIPTFSYGGRIEKDKGIWDLIAAVELLKEETKIPFSIKIAGTGDEFHNLEKYIKDNNLTCVTLLGKIKPDEILALYEESLAILGPSRWPEPFGRFILEAISVGKPIIATRSGGIADNVEDGKTGLLVDIGNSQQLATAMKYFIEDPDRSKLMLPAIIKKQNEFTGDNIGKRILELYKNLSKNHATC